MNILILAVVEKFLSKVLIDHIIQQNSLNKMDETVIHVF